MATSAPPLTGIRVLEFAGLAPGPFAGMLLADYGATVLRLDRAIPNATHTTSQDDMPPPTPDQLTRRKSSIAIDIKSPRGIALIKALLPHVDVIVDPFRPGVLEKAGLSPQDTMLRINPRLIVARMTGFRRDGKYAQMAGHDINYIAVSGSLSMLGRQGDRPYPPSNILGDFAGGGMICFVGVLLALLGREKSGRGQVVEANMVDGSAILTSMPRLAMKIPGAWDGERGTNRLDGGCPFYDVYETKDGRFMAVGALEPQFYAALLKGLSIDPKTLPGSRDSRTTWPWQRKRFTETFKSKTRQDWEAIFDGTDACCTPVLTQQELEAQGFQQRPAVTLRSTPGLAVADETEKLDVPAVRGQGLGVDGAGWNSVGLRPSEGGEEILGRWMGWKRGRGFEVENGGLIKPDVASL